MIICKVIRDDLEEVYESTFEVLIAVGNEDSRRCSVVVGHRES